MSLEECSKGLSALSSGDGVALEGSSNVKDAVGIEEEWR